MVRCPRCGSTAQVKVTGTNFVEDGWEIIYQVPASFVQRFFPDFKLESGKVLRANFYKCGDLTKQFHEICWNMIIDEKHDFHRPCDFGVLVLE